MIFHLLLLAASAAASPVPQGLTLAQFRQGARSLEGFGNQIKVQISPSYRKIRRHGRTQFIDTQDTIKKESRSLRQEFYPSARPVYVNTISDEDIEQKIREVNEKELEREINEKIIETAEEEVKGLIEKEVKEEIEEEMEIAMEEAIEKAIEQAIEEEIREDLEIANANDSESETVGNKFSPDEIVEEINQIEDMINENKMMQIVTDIVNTDDRENAELRDEAALIKNIDGFDIGLEKQPDTTPVMEIPFTSPILIINESASDDFIEIPKAPVKKTPISSIDFGLIQEV